VRCFDLRTGKNKKKARQVKGKVEIVWGDIRRSEQAAALVRDQEVIVHLAAVLPPDIYDCLEEAEDVNVNGTRYIIEAAKKQSQPPKILFSSSLDVFGFTQNQPPPRKITDPVQATDDYSRHKLQCEEMLKTSGLVWAIYRFADVPPLAARKPHPIMFRIPLATRFDMLHTADAGLAIANGVSSDKIWNRLWLIGGGSKCQVYYRDYLGRIMDAMGIGMLPDQTFGHDPYCTDWLDSEESQRVLNYQRHTFDEIINDLIAYCAPGGPIKLLMPVIRPLVRRWILGMSPNMKIK
jgi:nucleoside-diphosphate-sugar epimerase